MYGHCPVVEYFTNQQLERHGDRCFYCGTADFECIDHRMCVRVGGHHTLDNTVPCCQKCNQRKRWAGTTRSSSGPIACASSVRGHEKVPAPATLVRAYL